ncbi:MAG: YciI family protein [Aquabacterium sp.]
MSAVLGASAWAQLPAAPSVAAPAASAAVPAGLLFAVEIRTGPAWDAAKAPQEQMFFREHSAHLRRLREQGALVMGARYGDKGLIVLRAASEAEANAWLKDDPSMQAGTFRYELHEFRVFYSGTLAAPPRPR